MSGLSINYLKNVYLFKEFSEESLNLVSSISENKLCQPDEDLFKQDSPAEALYIIKSGMVRIHQKSTANDNIEIAVLGTGSHFGEMALVDGESRSATATTIEESEIIITPYQALKKLMDGNSEVSVKIYKSIAHFLCGRLRVTTHDLSFAREKNVMFF